ncbi:PSPB protein, partial [Chaetorhynchus papuensis]|nr:PSPB protein [Chaetorhynchus papuensis]
PPGRVLTVATGLGAPGGSCGVPPSAWCQNWVTALRCGALGRCPHLTRGSPDVDACAVCQQLVGFLHLISNQSTMEVPVGRGTGTLWVSLWVSPWGPRAQVPLGVVKPQRVCATVKLCHGEPRAAPAVPILEVPGPHLQGSGGAGLTPEALPVPMPLCWMCRKLVERAE